ncbi:zinc finger protein 346-like [Thalassophryne amazonica]|uniref:zinc finger protein 346-like n=1 Tax=Thalassophryne amazonica TaxID=390379 RepID=UPI0014715BA4|nr:zinc finger protein 346-like [Thalassophryne amazonica]
MQDENFPYAPSGAAAVNEMIKEHGNLFSDSQCNICNAVLISESQKLTHYQSKKHANKVRRYFSNTDDSQPASKRIKDLTSDSVDCNNGDTDRTKVCGLCNMTFSSPVMAESHYQGKVHAKNLRLKTVGPPTQDASQTAPTSEQKKSVGDSSGGEGNSGDRFCSMCKASFNNPVMAQQHYDGKKHKKQMTKVKLLETYGPSTTPASTLKGYPCTVCKIELNSVDQYQSHITGSKHKNQMKKSGMNPDNNQQAAEQPHGDNNNWYTAEDDQCAADNELLAGGDDQYVAGDDQYTTGGEDYNVGGNQYAADDINY